MALKSFSQFRRLRNITNVMFKQGMGYAIEKMRLKSHLKLHQQVKKVPYAEKRGSRPEKMREAMDELGGVFVKLGQMLSLRYDILPAKYCDEFAKLQDNVKPAKYSDIKKIIETELKKPINQIFKSFDKIPIASASIGQVHRAVLKNNKVVAVKVQKPNIDEVFKTDIELLYYLAALADKHIKELRDYNLKEIVEEFEDYTKKELDYNVEALHIKQFYEIYKTKKDVKIPNVYSEYTTKRVLTMEFIEGNKFSEEKNFAKKGTSEKRVMTKIIQEIINQIFEYQTFHADPHPGNIFVMNKARIAFLDFGIIGNLSKEMSEQVDSFLIGLVTKDTNLLTETLLEVGAIEDHFDTEKIKQDLSRELGKYYNLQLKEIDMREFLISILNITKKYKITLPIEFVKLFKSFITLQGFAKRYYPEFNFVKFMEPKVKKIIKKRSSPNYLYNQLKGNYLEFIGTLKNFPKDIKLLMRTLKYGVRTNVEIEDLKGFTLEMNHSSNRLTFGLIISALIIATAIIIQTKVPPLIKNIPLLAWLTIMLSTILGFILIISILKEGKEVNR